LRSACHRANLKNASHQAVSARLFPGRAPPAIDKIQKILKLGVFRLCFNRLKPGMNTPGLALAPCLVAGL
jgi:hypothetical protein